MKRIFVLLLAVLAVISATAVPASAAVRADDPPAGCSYTYPPLYSQRTETLIPTMGSNDGARVTLTNYVQVAESTNCADRVRGASTIRCYLHTTLPTSCATYGYTILQNTTSGSWADIPASLVNFNFTVPNAGSTSFYTAYRDRNLCVNYRVRVVISEVLINGQWVDTDVLSTASNAYIYCEV